MNVAILTVSTLSLAASVGTLLIMAKTARELQHGKEQVEQEVKVFREKTNRNFKRVKAVLAEMEL